jgi:general secretion pathway protein G
MKLRSTTTRNRQRRAGFTLMEMMVVVAIILSLAGLGIVYMAGQADEGVKTRIKTQIKSLTDVAIIYKTQHNGEWPQSLEQLTQVDPVTGNPPYIKMEDMLDPWNRPFQYSVTGQNNNGMQPDISCTPMNPAWGTFANWSRNPIR